MVGPGLPPLPDKPSLQAICPRCNTNNLRWGEEKDFEARRWPINDGTVNTITCRRDYLGDAPPHSIDFPWRSCPPPYGVESWHNDCRKAIIDALTSEGIIAWPGDGVECVLQIIEAYAKRIEVMKSHLVAALANGESGGVK